MEEEMKPETGTAPEAGEESKFNDLHGEVLGDRVKVLSPGRTVAKRFFRSKLSVVGLAIIVALFIFSFFGPLISPWGETQRDRSGKEVGLHPFTPYTFWYDSKEK